MSPLPWPERSETFIKSGFPESSLMAGTEPAVWIDAAPTVTSILSEIGELVFSFLKKTESQRDRGL